jgi:ribosomal protein S18 acetylase RimI-like enzyme
LLQEKKGERILHKKWEHSFILLDGENFVGIIVGYERDAEGNNQYPYNTIYLNDLAVSAEYQKRGLGKFLVHRWLDENTRIGFLELEGELRFSVQTNSASSNAHVQKLYESFGFKKIAEKVYDNRVDTVYLLEVEET